jgi:hypothetical protein
MRAVSSYVSAIVTAAMMASASGASAQDSKLSVPNVTISAPAAPVEPPYVGSRSPYFGRYRVEEDKFVEVPCATTRIAFGPSGKCLQGYRLGVPGFSGNNNSNPCDMALDVVIDTTGKLTIEADILVLDPYKVTATGSPPRYCYVRGQWRYNTATVQAEDIAFVLGLLQTRIYDSAGNLRQANDPTTYGPAGNQQRPGQ